MKHLLVALTALALLAGRVPAAAAAANGDDLFKAGDFAGAKAAYTTAVRDHSRDVAALLGLARLALYENDLDTAQRDAQTLMSYDAGNVAAKRILDTIAGRRTILASAMTLKVPAGGTTIPFLYTDPLPLMQVRINGHDANVLLDTGAPDLALDPGFAAELHLKVTDSGQMGQFAGNRSAQIRNAAVDTLEAGGVTISDVQAAIIPSRGLDFFKDRKVDGVIGTVFLSRFLATIDYPNHRLVLKPRSAAAPATAGTIAMPMWLVSDHFIFAKGSLNAVKDAMMLVDSGLAGGGFMPNNDSVETAKVQTFPDKAAQGIGGGGPVTFIPATADSLCLGTVCQQKVPGSYTPQGSPLQGFAFHTLSAVSHEFLKHYAVTFDFQGMQLFLTTP